MAREVTEKLIDDLDGSEAAETVAFGLDRATYNIDLSKRNAAAFRKTLNPYVKAAREGSKAARAPRPKTPASSNGSKPQRDYDIAQLREWAAANKVAIPSRGRIPQAVVAEYKAAGGR